MRLVSEQANLSEDERGAVEELSRRPWRMIVWRNSFRTILQAWPLLLILVAFALGGSWAPPKAGPEYFSAAAQVIPVLLLALAVESRMFSFEALFKIEPAPFLSPAMRTALPSMIGPDLKPMSTWILGFDTVMGWVNGALYALSTLIAGVGILVLLSLSEWECLRFLASSDDSADPRDVSSGILAGLVGIGLIALVGRVRQAQAPSGSAV